MHLQIFIHIYHIKEEKEMQPLVFAGFVHIPYKRLLCSNTFV